MTPFVDVCGGELRPPSAQLRELQAALRPGDAMLVGVGAHVHGVRFLLDGDEHLVGSGGEADVWLDHVTVAGRHARLFRTSAGWDVVDENTVGGTWVNGVPRRRASVANGDRVRFGALLFVVVTQVRARGTAPHRATAA